MTDPNQDRPLVLQLGHEELILRRRYEAVSICNDILIAVWFIVGSVLFFSPHLTTAGTWCFLAGSIQLLIRPAIRLVRLTHIERWSGTGGTGTNTDF